MLQNEFSQMAQEMLNIRMNLAWEELHSLGQTFSLHDGSLWVGEHELSGDNRTIDHIQALSGGSVNI